MPDMAISPPANRFRKFFASRASNSSDSSLSELDVARVIEDLENRTYLSFLCRARASERLELRGVLWMIALSTASAATLCASIFSLTNSPRPVSTIDLAATLFSLVTLVLSLIVSALNYQARSRDSFHSYREIQRVSSQIESLKHQELSLHEKVVYLTLLEMRYQGALDKSQNHTTFDYHRAKRVRDDHHQTADRKDRQRAIMFQGAITALPLLITFSGLAWLAFLFKIY